jgi:hypothetical protein
MGIVATRRWRGTWDDPLQTCRLRGTSMISLQQFSRRRFYRWEKLIFGRRWLRAKPSPVGCWSRGRRKPLPGHPWTAPFRHTKGIQSRLFRATSDRRGSGFLEQYNKSTKEARTVHWVCRYVQCHVPRTSIYILFSLLFRSLDLQIYTIQTTFVYDMQLAIYDEWWGLLSRERSLQMFDLINAAQRLSVIHKSLAEVISSFVREHLVVWCKCPAM